MYPFLVISDSFSSTSSIKREARELPDYLRCRIEQNQIFVQFRGGRGGAEPPCTQARAFCCLRS